MSSGAARRDVVEHDRLVGGARDLRVVRVQAPPVRPVVVRRHREDRVRPRLGGALGHLDGVPGVVGPGRGDDRGAARALGARQLDEAHVLLDRERRRLPRRPAHHDPVRPVGDEVVHQVDEGLLVDRPPVVEGRDDGGEDGSERHTDRLPCRGAARRGHPGPGGAWRRPTSGCSSPGAVAGPRWRRSSLRERVALDRARVAHEVVTIDPGVPRRPDPGLSSPREGHVAQPGMDREMS